MRPKATSSKSNVSRLKNVLEERQTAFYYHYYYTCQLASYVLTSRLFFFLLPLFSIIPSILREIPSTQRNFLQTAEQFFECPH